MTSGHTEGLVCTWLVVNILNMCKSVYYLVLMPTLLTVAVFAAHNALRAVEATR